MIKEISAGLDDFKKTIDKNALYVDKSDFIEEFLRDGSEVVAISRPRRFGKTLNMSMLSYFFDINNGEDNRRLFEGLKIENSPYFSEQGKYPVISITFKDIKSDSWEESYKDIVARVELEYLNHSYLRDSTKLDVIEKRNFIRVLEGGADISKYKSSLKDLSRYLHKHHGRKVIILIDEFDTPTIEGEMEGYFKKASKFMDVLLGGVLKSNENIHKGVVTGITRLQGAGIFSGVNNVDACTIFNKEYNDKFGFTEKEVKELLKEYGIEEKEKDVREYYNGYNFNGEVVYNPFSVIKYIQKREFANYWLGSSDNDLARKKMTQLLEMGEDNVIRKKIEDLVQGKKVKIEVEDVLNISEEMKVAEIINLLLYSGYLKYENLEKDADNVTFAEVSIPNLEIKAVYKKTINKWIESRYTPQEIEDLRKFFKSLCEGEEKEIKDRLERYLNRRGLMDGEKVLEMGYHNFLFGLLQGLEGKYILNSNGESGDGRFDIMLTPIKGRVEKSSEEKGIVIELKAGEKDKLKNLSKEALNQIEDKKYYKNLEGQGIKGVRLIGIAFNKKDAEVSMKEISLSDN